MKPVTLISSFVLAVVMMGTVIVAPTELAAQPATVDRQAVVRAAYENFVSTVYFLSGSDRFLNDLTTEERKQFDLLGHKLIPHQFRIGPVQPGEFRTSRLLSNKLRFSSQQQDFILKEGEPPRTAKMNGDIWFNLNIINDPSSKFSLLDAYQILYHEFGHLILESEGKDQDAIDRIAAKMRKHLQSSVREIEVTPTVRLSTHLLPQLLYNGMAVDFQPEPIVLITKDGITYEGRLPEIGFTGNGYVTSRPNELHAIKRVAITPSAEMDGERMLIKWSIEIGHFLVQSDHMNFIELFSNLDKVRNQLPFEPYYTGKESFKFVDLTTLAQDMPLKSYSENMVPGFSTKTLKWFEPLSYKGLKDGRVDFEGVVELEQGVREVAILGQRTIDSFQFPGTFEHLTGNIYRVRFSIPTETASAASVFLTGLSVNGTEATLLNEQVEVKPSARKSVSELLPARTTEVWDGSKWISASSITSTELAADDIRMRFHIKGATTPLNHIEVSWLVQEEVLLNDKSAGMRVSTLLEVIPASRLKQSFSGGVLTMEFEAKRGVRTVADTNASDGLTAKDSGYRAFLQAQFIDQNLNIAHVPNKLTTTGWRSLFKLNPRPQTENAASGARSNLRTCEGLFSAVRTY